MFSTITKVSLIVAAASLVSSSSLMAGPPPAGRPPRPAHAHINNVAANQHRANNAMVHNAHQNATTVEQHQAIAAHAGVVHGAIKANATAHHQAATAHHEVAVANRQAAVANHQAAVAAAAAAAPTGTVPNPGAVKRPAHAAVKHVAANQHQANNVIATKAHVHAQHVANTRFVEGQKNFYNAHHNATTTEQHEAINAYHATSVKNRHDKNVEVHQSINDKNTSVHEAIRTNAQNHHQAIRAYHEAAAAAAEEAAATVEDGF